MEKKSRLHSIIQILSTTLIIFLIGAVIILWGKTLLTKAEEPVRLPVIMYHSICERTPNEYIVTPQQAESDLAWLKEHGYTSVSAQQLIEYTHGKGSLPDKPVLITLDDGFYNNLSEFLPLLEKYDMKITKSGNKMAVISVADKSSNADMFAFDVACTQASQIGDTNRLYALKITPPRDANSKMIINQIIDIDEAKNGDIALRNAPRKKSQQDSMQTTKQAVSLVGKLEIDLELSHLNKSKINEIYQLAYRHNAKAGEKKSLLLRVVDENKNQVMLFTTEFSVSDEFENEVKMLLVG